MSPRPALAAPSPWVNPPTEDELKKASTRSFLLGQVSSDPQTSSGTPSDKEVDNPSTMRFIGDILGDRWTSSHSSTNIFRRSDVPRIAKISNEGVTRKQLKVSEIDAKIAAAEARTDTKFSEMMGELRVISNDMSHLMAAQTRIDASTSSLRSTIVTTAIVTVLSVAAIFVAVFAFGSQMFGVGMNAQSIADSAARTVEGRTVERMDSLDARLQELIGAVRDNQNSNTDPRTSAPTAP